MDNYELYHHGVKGQKWGVIREKKRATGIKRDKSSYTKEARSKRAGDSIKRANSKKGAAVLRRLGRTVGADVSQHIVTSAGTGALAGVMAVTAASVPPATIAAGAGMVALGSAYTVGSVKNLYRTARDVYDIAAYDPKTKKVN